MTVGDLASEAKGSGARFNEGKADFSLIPFYLLEGEARVWAYGRQKYAAWNWAKGMAWSHPYASLMRHLSAWQRGEECDPESGLPHLDHAACNLRMLSLYKTTYPEGDDRPVKWIGLIPNNPEEQQHADPKTVPSRNDSQHSSGIPTGNGDASRGGLVV